MFKSPRIATSMLLLFTFLFSSCITVSYNIGGMNKSLTDNQRQMKKYTASVKAASVKINRHYEDLTYASEDIQREPYLTLKKEIDAFNEQYHLLKQSQKKIDTIVKTCRKAIGKRKKVRSDSPLFKTVEKCNKDLKAESETIKKMNNKLRSRQGRIEAYIRKNKLVIKTMNITQIGSAIHKTRDSFDSQIGAMLKKVESEYLPVYDYLTAHADNPSAAPLPELKTRIDALGAKIEEIATLSRDIEALHRDIKTAANGKKTIKSSEPEYKKVTAVLARKEDIEQKVGSHQKQVKKVVAGFNSFCKDNGIIRIEVKHLNAQVTQLIAKVNNYTGKTRSEVSKLEKQLATRNAKKSPDAKKYNAIVQKAKKEMAFITRSRREIENAKKRFLAETSGKKIVYVMPGMQTHSILDAIKKHVSAIKSSAKNIWSRCGSEIDERRERHFWVLRGHHDLSLGDMS